MISSGPTAPGNGGFAKPQLPATVTGHGLGSLQGYLAWQPPMPGSSHHFSTSSQAFREEFFQNTSRRWIFNEADRLGERYVKFRPAELQRIAGEAVQQDYCPDMSKLAEGGFNKVFLLRAKNGREVIARIPTPVAGPPHYTTASEVATMEFLRTILKLPVPEILAYLTSSDNPVGAEYILIERVEGDSLSLRWLSLTSDEVKDIMT
ncbi:Protein kinase-like domain [Penicillium camemberti]|uniref:Protein kinase-like domain n=1 Tax=Penicillium camemberti (strain FM 013) TaxID=1429867 RepID=A0A0G4P9H0_PENC3|nr:Protein kinase-like domain [Penicillium camemberti]